MPPSRRDPADLAAPRGRTSSRHHRPGSEPDRAGPVQDHDVWLRRTVGASASLSALVNPVKSAISASNRVPAWAAIPLPSGHRQRVTCVGTLHFGSALLSGVSVASQLQVSQRRRAFPRLSARVHVPFMKPRPGQSRARRHDWRHRDNAVGSPHVLVTGTSVRRCRRIRKPRRGWDR